MTSRSPLRIGPIRVSDEGHRVTTFELFFDLVFVFAFTQVTVFMADAHDAPGILRGMTILALLWWSWVAYSWLANQTHVDEGIVRIGMSVAMIAMFVIALAIPEAYDDLAGGLDGPLVLASAYLVVRVIHLLLYTLAAGDDRALRQQLLWQTLAMVAGCAFLFAGAVLGGQAQAWLWLTGLAVDLLLTYLLSNRGGWRLYSAAHWAERYGLVVILALGESIVAIGVGAAQLPISVPVLAGSALAVGLSICLWWTYFDAAAAAAERVLAAQSGTARVQLAADAYTFLHLPLVAGIIMSALGVESAIAHIDEAEPFGYFGAWALLGGTSLYLAGHAVFVRRSTARWSVTRLVGGGMLLALVPVAALLPPLATLVLALLPCAAVVTIDTLRSGRERAAASDDREPRPERRPEH